MWTIKCIFETSDWGTMAKGQPDYYTYPAPFDRPFYMILNLAVGGDWPGNPKTDFKSDKMYVDYVRVYKYKNLDQWPDVTGKRPVDPGLSTPQRPALADGNQIYNGDFKGAVAAQGQPEYWELIENESGSGTVSVIEDQDKGKAVKVAVHEAGTQNYSIQLAQKPLLLERDKSLQGNLRCQSGRSPAAYEQADRIRRRMDGVFRGAQFPAYTGLAIV
ncbi:hypothetical protein ACFSQ7_12610 [Paenibacillus rhizoplanae]